MQPERFRKGTPLVPHLLTALHCEGRVMPVAATSGGGEIAASTVVTKRAADV